MTQGQMCDSMINYAMTRTSELVLELIRVALTKGLPTTSLQDAVKDESFTLLDSAARQIDIPLADKLSEMTRFLIHCEKELGL